MFLAECSAIGFGVPHNVDILLSWMSKAASLGSSRASLWLPRVRFALGKDGNSCSSDPAIPAGSLDLLSLMRFNRDVQREIARTDLDDDKTAGKATPPPRLLHVKIFDEEREDTLEHLHYHAWLGNINAVDALAKSGVALDTPTPKGQTALYFACLAGELDLVRLLLSHNADPTITDQQGVTLMHLCIMFNDLDVSSAFEALHRCGASLDAELHHGSAVNWRFYDLSLWSLPLHWAIKTRHAVLVRVYLDAGVSASGNLWLAVHAFFPEIVDLLLERGDKLEADATLMEYLETVDSPFGHWRHHGPDRLRCKTETIDVMEHHGYFMADCQEKNDEPADTLIEHPMLFYLVTSARVEEDLQLIYEYTNRVRGKGAHWTTSPLILLTAIRRPPNACGYEELLHHLIPYHKGGQLDQYDTAGRTCLHGAIQTGRVAAAKLLLEYGADVQCPRS
ncbi:ankyrin repeat-containing domain protein [Aspergillus insuetus]